MKILVTGGAGFIGSNFVKFILNKYPEYKIVEKFQSKIAELPREKEKTFMFRLMNMLTNQILADEEEDKLLAGALALRILGGIFVEIFGGRNAQIRAIRLNQLLKDRKVSNLENKKKIDEHINRKMNPGILIA